MRGPREARHFVLSAARVASHLVLQLEKHEVVKAIALELPRRAQASDPATDDDDRDSPRGARRRPADAVTQTMPHRGAVVHERSGDAAATLSREAEQRGRAREWAREDDRTSRCTQTTKHELATRDFHRAFIG
jgi:hypothetical protein